MRIRSDQLQARTLRQVQHDMRARREKKLSFGSKLEFHAEKNCVIKLQ